MEIKYREHLSEPWFTLISLGLKSVEGRRHTGRFQSLQIGDLIQWYNDDFGGREVLTRVVRKSVYGGFREYLEVEGLGRCLPGMPTIEHGLRVYYKYYTVEDEVKFGVVAITLEIVNQ